MQKNGLIKHCNNKKHEGLQLFNQNLGFEYALINLKCHDENA